MHQSFIHRLKVLFTASLIAVAAFQAHGRSKDIVIEGSRAYPVHVKGLFGKFGNQATGTLREELEKSGLVTLSSSASGSFVASGKIDGHNLAGTVLDPSGGTLLKKSYTGASLKANVLAFSNDIIGALSGEMPVTGRIVFVSTRTGKKEIYTCSADGSDVRRLTSDNGISVSPAISPDGATIAYTGYESGYADVYVIKSGSGQRRKIINSPGTNSGASISPDGSRLALTMSFVGNPEIFVTSMSGGRAKRLTNNSGVDSSPSWSPDGSRVVYSSDGGGRPQLHTVSTRGGSPKLLNTGYGFCVEPSWSPDGEKIAFCVRQGGGMRLAVYEFATGKTKILSSGEDPSWAPDSRHFAFTRGGALMLRDYESGNEKTILRHGKISEPNWTRK